LKLITPAQIKKIYALARERGVDNDALHAVVHNIALKDSIKALFVTEAAKVIDRLNGADDRPCDMMSAAQEKYIKGLFSVLDWDDDKIRPWLHNRFAVDHMRWLTVSKAAKVIEGLKEMTKRAKGS